MRIPATTGPSTGPSAGKQIGTIQQARSLAAPGFVRPGRRGRAAAVGGEGAIRMPMQSRGPPIFECMVSPFYTNKDLLLPWVNRMNDIAFIGGAFVCQTRNASTSACPDPPRESHRRIKACPARQGDRRIRTMVTATQRRVPFLERARPLTAWPASWRACGKPLAAVLLPGLRKPLYICSLSS